MEKVTIKKLIELADVKLITIQRRIKDGFIKVEKPDGYHTLIDLNQFEGKDLKKIFLKRKKSKSYIDKINLINSQEIKETPPIDNFIFEDFLKWTTAENSIMICDKEIKKSDAYNDFVLNFNIDVDFLSKRKFTSFIDRYCKIKNLILFKGRNSKFRFFKIKKKKMCNDVYLFKNYFD